MDFKYKDYKEATCWRKEAKKTGNLQLQPM